MKLFLDDYRNPVDCCKYMWKYIDKQNLIYLDDDWYIVCNYPEFIEYIKNNTLPELISFDHDLADGHYHRNMQEGKLDYESKDFESDDYNKTGYHCAKWLLEYCQETKQEFPEFIVHSMNPVGKENIINLLTNKN